MWLDSNLTGKSITLLDKNKELVDDFDAKGKEAYIFTEEGFNVNKFLRSSRVVSLKRELDAVQVEISSKTLSEIYAQYQSAVFIIYTSDNKSVHQGTGFFVSNDGIAVSNYHVFDSTERGLEVIKAKDGAEYKVESVLAYSREKDFIVFKIAGLSKPTNFFPIASSTPPVGSSVFTIGNPKGLESTLSTGIISSLRENGGVIQTTTEITNGSSGGPLLNMNAEVIGITTAGVGEANLNFAVNIDLLGLKSIIEPK